MLFIVVFVFIHSYSFSYMSSYIEQNKNAKNS